MGTVGRFLDPLLTYGINVFPELCQNVLELFVLFVSEPRPHCCWPETLFVAQAGIEVKSVLSLPLPPWVLGLLCLAYLI